MSSNYQSNNRRFIECPRCRNILLAKIRGVRPVDKSARGDDGDDSTNDCDCSECEAERRERGEGHGRVGGRAYTAKSMSLHVPSFKSKVWYVGRKRGVAKLLWTASLLHRDFMPFEALGGEEDGANILRLTSWGIIERVPGRGNESVYRIGRRNQTRLIKFFRNPDPSEKDEKSLALLISGLAPSLLYAAWRHLKDEYRVDRSLRAMNRLFFLGLYFFDYLPPLPLSWWQELVVTSLILFSAALLLQFLLVLVVYAAAFVGTGASACYVLRRSNSVKSCWWQGILLSYFVYRLNEWFYVSSYLKWGVLISPKALIPVKKFLWG